MIAKLRNLTKNNLDQQLTQNDCGVSAVKTVLNHHNIDIPRGYIKDRISLDDMGASFADLKTFIKEQKIRDLN